MTTIIKVGRKEFEVKSGDYLMDNGVCIRFFSGDGRALVWEKYSPLTSVLLPLAAIKKIDFTQLRHKKHRVGIDLYFF